MVSAWISFSLGFFLGRGGSAGFFSQTLRFVDILLGHSPPSEDITLSCLVKTIESLGERGHIVAVLKQEWDAADWTSSQLFCSVPMPASLADMGVCRILMHVFSNARTIAPNKGWTLWYRALESSLQNRLFKANPRVSVFTSTVTGECSKGMVIKKVALRSWFNLD